MKTWHWLTVAVVVAIFSLFSFGGRKIEHTGSVKEQVKNFILPNHLLGKRLVREGSDIPTGLQSGDIIRQEDLPPRSRVLKSGEMATTDYSPTRLNVEVDESDQIIGFRYG